MPGGTRLKEEVLTTSACSLCGACLDWCPYLKNLEDHLVMRFDCPLQEGRCYSVCPRTLTDWEPIEARYLPDAPPTTEVGTCLAVYRAKATPPVPAQQDGGTVTALVKTALEEKLVEAALLTGARDALTPSSYIAFHSSEIEKAAGSRFLASPGLRTWTEAQQKGITSLAVVGRPCQVQALRKMQFNCPPDQPELDVISIGLFCMWSLSWEFKDFLARQYPEASIFRMTIPRQGIELSTSTGTISLPIEKVREFIRPGCTYCLDMTSELADISIGALEAVPGWNTVIVRSQRGSELLDKARNSGTLVVEEYPSAEWERLLQASLNKKTRGLTALEEAVAAGRMKSFLDLSSPRYQQILARAERRAKS